LFSSQTTLRETLNQMVNLTEFKSTTDGSIKSRMDDQKKSLLRDLFFLKNFIMKTIPWHYNGYMDYFFGYSKI
jgi:hypothetical protein